MFLKERKGKNNIAISMMQTLQMDTEVPYARAKIWDPHFITSRRGSYLLAQIVSLFLQHNAMFNMIKIFQIICFMATIFGILSISRGRPTEFVIFVIVLSVILATTILEMIYRLFNLAEAMGKRKMLIKAILDKYLPIGRCVLLTWTLFLCSTNGKSTRSISALVRQQIYYLILRLL